MLQDKGVILTSIAILVQSRSLGHKTDIVVTSASRALLGQPTCDGFTPAEIGDYSYQLSVCGNYEYELSHIFSYIVWFLGLLCSICQPLDLLFWLYIVWKYECQSKKRSLAYFHVCAYTVSYAAVIPHANDLMFGTCLYFSRCVLE